MELLWDSFHWHRFRVGDVYVQCIGVICFQSLYLNINFMDSHCGQRHLGGDKQDVAVDFPAQKETEQQKLARTTLEFATLLKLAPHFPHPQFPQHPTPDTGWLLGHLNAQMND